MNDGGFMALMDAMLFIVIVLMAASVMFSLVGGDDMDDRDASRFLDDVLSSEVRVSDMSDGDDSMVRLSDMIAFCLQTGEDGPMRYITEVLDSFSAGRGYLFNVEFDNGDEVYEGSLGSVGRLMSAYAYCTVQVSTGGSLTAEITLYRS